MKIKTNNKHNKQNKQRKIAIYKTQTRTLKSYKK